MILKPIRIQAGFLLFLISAMLISGCSLFGDDAATPVPPAIEAESLSPSTEPTPEDIDVLAAALAECRQNAVMTDGVIWLRRGAEPQEVAGLEEFLASSATVISHRYIDADETYEDFVKYFEDEPEIVELVQPEQLPTSFTFEFAAEADIPALVAEIERFGPVDSVEQNPDESVCLTELTAIEAACEQPPSELSVWMPLRVDQLAIDATAQILIDSPAVERFRYIGPAETLAEFEASFADDPEVVDLVDPDNLPTKFTVALAEELRSAEDWEQQIEELRSALQASGMVDQVDEGVTRLSHACWDGIQADVVADLVADAGTG